MTLQELREKRAKALDSLKKFLETHRDTNGTLSVENSATYDKMEQELNNLGSEIQRLEKLETLENQLAQPTSRPITHTPEDVQEPTSVRASKEYKEGVLQALRTGFKQISNVLQTGVDTDGGYLVPEEMDSRLYTTLEENNVMRTLATGITTQGERKMNIATTQPTAAWIDEGEELQFSDAEFTQKLLDAHKLHAAVKVTEELLHDNAFNLENYISEAFGKALANKEEEAFLVGDGVGKPSGVFHKEKGGVSNTVASGTLTADELIQMVYTLKRPYRKKAVFVMNDAIIANIRKFKDSNGQYIWQPALIGGEPDKLLGYPVYTSQYAPLDAVAFGDFSYYQIGDRGTRSFKQLTELFAGNGMVGFVAKERVDGLLILQEAVQILWFSAVSAVMSVGESTASTWSLSQGMSATETGEGATEVAPKPKAKKVKTQTAEATEAESQPEPTAD